MNILLIGQMGSGKDFVADILQEKYGYKNHKLGKYIRKHVDEIYSHLPVSQRREYYQKYGETLRENIDIDIWNEACLRGMEQEDIINGSIVISDARQPHEIYYWTNLGFIPVGVFATKETRMKRLGLRDGDASSESTFNHSTEKNAGDIIKAIFDGKLEGYFIVNEGEKEIAEQRLEDIYGFLKRKGE